MSFVLEVRSSLETPQKQAERVRLNRHSFELSLLYAHDSIHHVLFNLPVVPSRFIKSIWPCLPDPSGPSSFNLYYRLNILHLRLESRAERLSKMPVLE